MKFIPFLPLKKLATLLLPIMLTLPMLSLGQHVLSRQYSKKTFLYQLSELQFQKLMLAGNRADTLDVFKDLHVSFYSDSIFNFSKLPFGHYLEAKAVGSQISFRTISNSFFNISSYGVNDEIWIVVADRLDKVITDAKIKFGEKEITYDESCGCYPLKAKNYTTNVVVQKGEHYQFFSISSEKQKKDKYKPTKPDYVNRYNAYERILPGYIVTNKPKYRLGDTVKVKAFLLNEYGHPWRSKVSYSLKTAQGRRVMYSGKIKAVSPGAYVFDFVVPDTLIIDQDYSLEIHYSNGSSLLKKHTIRIEDYELNDVKVYTATAAKPMFYRGEDIRLFLSAKDLNGLPLMDERINVKIKVNRFRGMPQEHLFLPFKWYDKFIEKSFSIDPSGTEVFTMADSLLPLGDFLFDVKVTFTNSKNEINKKNLQFSYSSDLHQYRFFVEGDTVRGLYFYKGQLSELKEHWLVKKRMGRVLDSSKIQLPFSQALDLAATQYQLFKGDSLVYNISVPDQVFSMLRVQGKRKHDSIRISLKNQLGIDVHYRIFKRDEQVYASSGKEIDFTAEDESLDSYHVIYSFLWHGKFYIKEQAFHLDEMRLFVDIEQEETIYPGENIPVKITVRDYKGKPMKKVNLTAYAVNMKFDNIPTPDLPYFGRIHQSLLSIHRVSLSNKEVRGSFTIDKQHVKKFELLNTPFYQLAYDLDGIGVYEDSVNSSWGILNPILFSHYNVMKVYTVYANGKPLYINGSSNVNPMSFKLKPGKYTIKLRADKKMYAIKDVEIKAGIQTFVCLNTRFSEQNSNVRIQTLGPELYNEAEKEMLEPHFILVSSRYRESIYIEQDSLVSFLSSQYYGSHYHKGYNYQIIGPVHKGNINITNLRSDTAFSFYFEPGYLYFFNGDTLEITQPELDPDIYRSYQIRHSQVGWEFYTKPLKAPALRKHEEEKAIEKEKIKIENTEVDFDNPVKGKRLHTVHPLTLNKKEYSFISFINSTEKQVKWVLLWKEGHKAQSSVLFAPLRENNRMNNGDYQLFLYLEDSTYVQTDVTLQDSGVSYVQFLKEDIQPYDSVKVFNAFEKVYELNKAPLNDFEDYPEVYSNYRSALRRTATGEAMISGYILDFRKKPINNAMIFLEKRGDFVEGAMTNADGYFEIRNIPSGAYQLKINSFNRNQWVIKNLVVSRGYETRLLLEEKINVNSWTLDEVVLEAAEVESDVYSYATTTSESISNLPMRATGVYSTSPGVTANGDGYINIKGSRSENTKYFIDGVKVRGNVNVPRDAVLSEVVIANSTSASYGFNRSGAINAAQRAHQSTSQKYESYLYGEDDNEQVGKKEIQKLKNKANTNVIRKVFRDYAYWQPNMVTDKNGEAYFIAKYPDNITRWKTIVPAMSYKKHSGMATHEVEAYKPLSAVLSLPYFLIEEDNVTLNGTIYNYTSDSLTIRDWFLQGSDTLQKNNETVVNYVKRDQQVEAKRGNEFFEYGLLESTGYKDGEQRKVKVLPNGIVGYTTQPWDVRKDSTMVYLPDPTIVSRSILITNNKWHIYQNEIEELKQYHYGCNEQTASKLTALLLEKRMLLAQGEKFRDERLVMKCIRILERNQNKDGSYGWWGRSSSNIFITTYVLKALNQAVEQGYKTRAHMNAGAYLTKHIDDLSTSEKIRALDALSSIPYPINKEKYITWMDSLNLSFHDKLLKVKVKQRYELEYTTDFIVQAVANDKNGSFWGEELFNIEVNRWSVSMIAYSILREEGGHDSLLAEVRRYFLNQDLVQRNTLEKSLMLSEFMQDIFEHQSFEKEIKGFAQVNGKEVNAYPYFKMFTPQDTVEVQKKGDALYLYHIYGKLEKQPESNDSLIRVRTYFMQDGKEKDSLVWNKPMEMKVEVLVKEDREYVLIEAPIPASCSYDVTRRAHHAKESYREQFRDKTSIACARLPRGKHTFTVYLIPKFKGSFTCLPTKAGDMYFQAKNGYSENRSIIVYEKEGN